MVIRRLYKNPPIEEALCEVRFQSQKDWDPTIPGKLHSLLSEDYSGTPEQQKALEVGFEAGNGTTSKFSYSEGIGRVQLYTDDKTRMISVGPDSLGIHMLRPYIDKNYHAGYGWPEFEDRIANALNHYWDLARPEGVKRIGVRYINKINIPETSVPIAKYLKCTMPDLSGLPSDLKNFLSRVEYVYPDDVVLVLSQGSVNAPDDNHVGFILDLDVIWSSDHLLLDRNESMSKTSDLRSRELEAFEAVITEDTRSLFNDA